MRNFCHTRKREEEERRKERRKRENKEEGDVTFSAARARTQGKGEREMGEMKRMRESKGDRESIIEGKGGKIEGK